MKCAPLRLLAALAAAAVVMAPWWAGREESGRSFPGFVVPPPVETSDHIPLFVRQVINPDSIERKAHSATLVELPGGEVLAAWYAGHGEGAADVTIQTASRGLDGVWSVPHEIFNRAGVAAALNRHVLSLGNPVLLPGDGDGGGLGLLFVSISAGKWSGSSLNLSWSGDRGRTWSAPRKLTLNPLADLSALPRNPPAALVGGGFAVPIYQEFLGLFPEILWLQPHGGRWTAAVSRIAGGMWVFQPTLVPLSRQRALALLRDGKPERKSLQASWTEDGGRSWTEPVATGLPNANSGVCAVRLPDGRLLCAFNDSPRGGRDILRLALSRDEGRTWRKIAVLEEEEGKEFSYPFMIVGRGGQVRMVYSAYGARIVYVEFNAAWIDAQEAGAERRTL